MGSLRGHWGLYADNGVSMGFWVLYGDSGNNRVSMQTMGCLWGFGVSMGTLGSHWSLYADNGVSMGTVGTVGFLCRPWGAYGVLGSLWGQWGWGGSGCPFGVAVGFLGRSRVHVVLEGEDDGIWGRLEGALSNGLNHLLRVMGSAGSAGSMGSMGSVAFKGS